MKIGKLVYKHMIVLFALLIALSGVHVPTINAEPSSGASKTEASATKSLSKQEETNYKPTDKVTIIVELETDPGIIVAQRDNKKFSSLSENTKKSLHKKAIDEQQAIKNDIDAQNVTIDYFDDFTAVFNGFSGEVEYQDIAEIEKLDNVKAVHISEEYDRPVTPIEPQIYSHDEQRESNTANDLVNAPMVWEDIGFKGEGMVVAVLDDGIDVEHRDMVLSDTTDPALNEDNVAEMIADQGLSGEFYTDKVPYGYNYADKDNIIKDLGDGANNHGMHVSGIVGANGDTDNGGIKGVAPEVQILGMKIFSNDQTSGTKSSIYVKAIDDAVKLNADAINMSFGSTSKVPSPDDPAQVAIQRATENGILVTKSAGNGYRIGRDYSLPFVENPDLSVSSSPHLAEGSIAVANFENTHLDYPAFSFDMGDGSEQLVAFNPASKAPSPDSGIDENERDVVFVGYGRMPGDSDDHPDANDFEGIDLEGKIALIERGEIGYVEKTLNAQAHGAEAVIVFNNVDDDNYSSMSSDPSVEIPQVFILKRDGDAILHQLENDEPVKIAFKGDRVKTESPRTGKLSQSSAWGPPNLDLFIPGITGVGSEILSTLNDDTYGVKSGGSMSAPQVAGGSTLVMTRLNEEFNLQGLELTTMTKNILMNTAKPIENISQTSEEFGIEGVPYTPRRQGAGLMDLYAAIHTPVVITDINSGLGGVTLKEIGDETTFTLELENFSDEDIAYRVTGNVQSNLAEGKYDYLESIDIMDENGEVPLTFNADNGEEVHGNYVINIPNNSTATLDITINLDGAIDGYLQESIKELFVNGRFIEGFIEFTDVNDTYPDLSVPYFGFYGDWNKPPVLDAFIHEGERSFYGTSGMLTDNDTDEYLYLGVDPISGEMTDHFAISPNGNGVNDNVLPALSFLRNAKEVEFVILDSDGNELDTLMEESLVRKHYDSSDSYTTYDKALWDGKIDGEVVEDGLYYYTIKTRIDHKDVDWQITQVPIIVDTVKPDVEATFDNDKKQVQWTGDDNGGSGIMSYEVIVNGEHNSDLLSSDVLEYTIQEDISDISSVVVIATDWAGNQTEVVAFDESSTSPTISDMKDSINQLLADGEIKNQGIARSLTAQLETVERFENKGKMDKAMKHLEDFKELLQKRKENKAITEAAYDTLIDLANQVTESWQ